MACSRPSQCRSPSSSSSIKIPNGFNGSLLKHSLPFHPRLIVPVRHCLSQIQFELHWRIGRYRSLCTLLSKRKFFYGQTKLEFGQLIVPQIVSTRADSMDLSFCSLKHEREKWNGISIGVDLKGMDVRSQNFISILWILSIFY